MPLSGPNISTLMDRFHVDPDMRQLLKGITEEELDAFAMTQDEAEDESSTGLYIYVRFTVFVCNGSIQRIQQALLHAEGWATLPSESSAERARRLDILNELLALRLMDPWRDLQVELSNKAVELMRLYRESGGREILDEAFATTEKAMTMAPLGSDIFIATNGNLGSMYGLRFNITGNMEDLDRAIELTWTSIKSISSGHPNEWILGCLGRVTRYLESRFDLTQDASDLEGLVTAHSMVVDATALDSPDKPNRFHQLGSRLKELFDKNGSLETLDKFIEAITVVASSNHPDRLEWLNEIAIQLGNRYQRLGDQSDLNKAITIADETLTQVPPSHPHRLIWANTLTRWLGIRYHAMESMDDLSRAIEALEGSITSILDTQSGALFNLGQLLRFRFERTGTFNDIERSIELIRLSTEIESDASGLNGLGDSLRAKYKKNANASDLSDAIEATKKAVDMTAQGHPSSGLYLDHLGSLHYLRYTSKTAEGDIEDLNEAIRLHSLGVEATPVGDPQYSGRINNLGIMVGLRYRKTKSPEDLVWSKSCFQMSIDYQSSSSTTVMHSIQNVTKLFKDELGYEQMSEYLDKAVHLLSSVSPMSFSQEDKQYLLAKFSGIASKAAAAALNAGKGPVHALQMLEQGRGVIMDHFMKTRTNFAGLEETHPDIVARFHAIRDSLESMDHNPKLRYSENNFVSSLETRVSTTTTQNRNDRVQAEKDFQDICEEIRELPCFGDFLLPPTAQELMDAADPDPIAVINISSVRCDAFLVEKHQIRHLELRSLETSRLEAHVILMRTTESIYERPVAIKFALEWMWEFIAEPVLDALGFTESPSGDNWPRIWWIPTGPLSQLPLHAAGNHYRFPRSNDTVLDRVMSSYSSSIKALIYGRRRSNIQTTQHKSGKALIVAIPDADGEQELFNAIEEADALERLCPSLKLDPVRPELQRDEILRSLRDCTIFHFAGHAVSDPSDPSKSGLLLQEGLARPLTVLDLRGNKLQDDGPFLAYLSACCTSAAEAGHLLDENIHLANACQLAGFRHIISTLWEVSDPHCVDVAQVLYETLRDDGMTDRAVCKGLHKAVKMLRDTAVANEARELEKEEKRIADRIADTDMDCSSPMDLSALLDTIEDEGLRAALINSVFGETSEATSDAQRSVADVVARNLMAVNSSMLRFEFEPTDLFWVPFLHFGV